MELSTVRALAELNRQFYEEHAENFADSRPRLQPGVRRSLERIPPGARVLDLGCGDGKVARALRGVDYVGVDQSAALLRRADAYTTRYPNARRAIDAGQTPLKSIAFVQADLLSGNLPAGPFDFVLAFAVFHHLPGLATRQRVLTELVEHLAPDGTFVMSNWQFHTSARLQGRRALWSVIGLSEADVEPGDALLTWERKGQHGLRYVHALDLAEAHSLTAGAGLTIIETFISDGHSGDLAEYVAARAALPEHPASPNSAVSW